MAEFFVNRGYRRRGFGNQVAHALWRRFPGPWEIRVMQSNATAQHFWTHAISIYTGNAVHLASVEKDGQPWVLFSFDSNRPA
jgi:predicted acetyltransferase